MSDSRQKSILLRNIKTDYERYRAICREHGCCPESFTVYRNDWIANYETELRKRQSYEKLEKENKPSCEPES